MFAMPGKRSGQKERAGLTRAMPRKPRNYIPSERAQINTLPCAPGQKQGGPKKTKVHKKQVNRKRTRRNFGGKGSPRKVTNVSKWGEDPRDESLTIRANVGETPSIKKTPTV